MRDTCCRAGGVVPGGVAIFSSRGRQRSEGPVLFLLVHSVSYTRKAAPHTLLLTRTNLPRLFVPSQTLTVAINDTDNSHRDQR
jgi:hypothetical protein